MADKGFPGAQKWVPERGGLPTVRAAAAGCRGCDLWKDATQTVVSSGTSRAGLMLVGETPGDHEDKKGQVFVGPPVACSTRRWRTSASIGRAAT
jgi:DNA polymerase